MSDHPPCQATPTATLEQQIMSPNVPKNEREHWAAREIDRLRNELTAIQAQLVERQDYADNLENGLTSARLDRATAERSLGLAEQAYAQCDAKLKDALVELENSRADTRRLNAIFTLFGGHYVFTFNEMAEVFRLGRDGIDRLIAQNPSLAT